MKSKLKLSRADKKFLRRVSECQELKSNWTVKVNSEILTHRNEKTPSVLHEPIIKFGSGRLMSNGYNPGICSVGILVSFKSLHCNTKSSTTKKEIFKRFFFIQDYVVDKILNEYRETLELLCSAYDEVESIQGKSSVSSEIGQIVEHLIKERSEELSLVLRNEKIEHRQEAEKEVSQQYTQREKEQKLLSASIGLARKAINEIEEESEY